MPQTQKENAIGLRAVCFVDMPFGKKSDLASGVEVDFDLIYDSAIKPAITDCNLEPVRGDQERTGGIVHAPMFGKLLLSDYVVADLTLSNANVFYELGIRHTARPFTTVPVFATIHSLPFDFVFSAAAQRTQVLHLRVAVPSDLQSAVWTRSGLRQDPTHEVKVSSDAGFIFSYDPGHKFQDVNLQLFDKAIRVKARRLSRHRV